MKHVGDVIMSRAIFILHLSRKYDGCAACISTPQCARQGVMLFFFLSVAFEMFEDQPYVYLFIIIIFFFLRIRSNLSDNQ